MYCWCLCQKLSTVFYAIKKVRSFKAQVCLKNVKTNENYTYFHLLKETIIPNISVFFSIPAKKIIEHKGFIKIAEKAPQTWTTRDLVLSFVIQLSRLNIELGQQMWKTASTNFGSFSLLIVRNLDKNSHWYLSIKFPSTFEFPSNWCKQWMRVNDGRAKKNQIVYTWNVNGWFFPW